MQAWAAAPVAFPGRGRSGWGRGCLREGQHPPRGGPVKVLCVAFVPDLQRMARRRRSDGLCAKPRRHAQLQQAIGNGQRAISNKQRTKNDGQPPRKRKDMPLACPYTSQRTLNRRTRNKEGQNNRQRTTNPPSTQTRNFPLPRQNFSVTLVFLPSPKPTLPHACKNLRQRRVRRGSHHHYR